MILSQIVHYCFICYTGMLIIRIVASWFPRVAFSHPVRFISFYTDPYLNVFRRLIPPIGGMLDLSPFLAYVGLTFSETIIQSIIYRCLI